MMEERNANEQEQMFIGFVSIIAGMAMQQLGKVMNPLTGKAERNLDIAKAWIETLRMLKTKTSGNLNNTEQNFLDTTIANLQMNYVDEMKRPPEKEQKEETPEKKSESESGGGDERKDEQNS